MDVDPQTNPPLFEWVEEQRALYKLWKQQEEQQKWKGSVGSSGSGRSTGAGGAEYLCVAERRGAAAGHGARHSRAALLQPA